MVKASTRLGLALTGITLWFACPFVLWNGHIAAFQYRCSREPAINGSDPCFTDYIPVLEMVAFILTLTLAYPFARFAFSLFAPAQSERGRGWRLASSSAGSENYPSLQILAGIGAGWALVQAKNYPFALYPYLAYWAAWIGWFCIGIWMSWPPKKIND